MWCDIRADVVIMKQTMMKNYFIHLPVFSVPQLPSSLWITTPVGSRLATRRPFWWRILLPLTARSLPIPEVERTPNPFWDPPGSTRTPRPEKWRPWRCFLSEAIRRWSACPRPDAGTHWTTCCPTWTLTTQAWRWSRMLRPWPQCPVMGVFTWTWACVAFVLIVAFWTTATACPLLSLCWDEAQRCEPSCGPLCDFFEENNQPFMQGFFSVCAMIQ